MRTTLNIDDFLLRQLRSLAEKQNAPMRQVVNAALRSGLEQMHNPPRTRKRFRVKAVSLGKPQLPLTKALGLVDASHDEEALRKMNLRK